MSAKKKYERLVQKWGRDMTREIFFKRASTQAQKQVSLQNTKDRKFLLPGSFESGKRR